MVAKVVVTALLVADHRDARIAAVAGVLAGLAWPPIGVAAAIGAALLLLGAIGFHVRTSDSAADSAPAVIGLGLAVATAILQPG